MRRGVIANSTSLFHLHTRSVSFSLYICRHMGICSAFDVFVPHINMTLFLYTSSSSNFAARKADSDHAPELPSLAFEHMVSVRRSSTLRHEKTRGKRCLSIHEANTSFSGGCTRKYLVGTWSIYDPFVPVYFIICPVWDHLYCKATCVAIMTLFTLSRPYGDSLTFPCPYIWQQVLVWA